MRCCQSDLEEAGCVERDHDGSIAIVEPPETFKTSVRDLVAKLKTFRYEGERRLRLIADYAHSKECRSVFIGGISGRSIRRAAGRATAVAPTALWSSTRALHRRIARRMDRAPVTRATHLPGARDGDANAFTHEASTIAGPVQHAYFNGCWHRCTGLLTQASDAPIDTHTVAQVVRNVVQRERS
jgi:hypothetical protein